MRILVAGVLGGIAMFVWTSIAHMALPLGEAGIGEIPNESVVLSAMQSSMGKKTGLYVFPGLGVGKNATRQEKSEAMKQMQQRIAANPSGILMYHPPGRQFAFAKSLAVELSTEVGSKSQPTRKFTFSPMIIPDYSTPNRRVFPIPSKSKRRDCVPRFHSKAQFVGH